MIYHFAEFVLDTERFELRANGEPVAIEPLAFDLLALLVARPERLVSRDDLIETLWDGRIVSESAISTVIKTARRAVGDDGSSQRLIKTVRGRGLQFAGKVECDGGPDAPQTPADAASTDLPTIGVLALAGGAGQTGLARLIDMRLRSVLTRVPLLRIVPLAADAPGVDDPARLRHERGFTLLLRLHVVELGGRILLAASLVETRFGSQLWGQDSALRPEADGALETLVAQLVGRVEPLVLRAMMDDLGQAGDAGHARRMLLRAMGLLGLKGYRRETFLEAERWLEDAISTQPDLALAHAYLALLNGFGHRVGILREDPEVSEKAAAAAERALALNDQDSMVLGLAGCALADIGQVDRAVLILRRAIEINPHNGHAKTALGAACLVRNELAAAEALLREGIESSPADARRAVWGAAHAVCLLLQGRAADACEVAEAACVADDRNYMPRVALAAARLAMGRPKWAAAAVKDALRIRPDLREPEVRHLVGPQAGSAIWGIRNRLKRTAGKNAI